VSDCEADVDDAETGSVLERVSDSWLVVELDVSTGAELDGGTEVDGAETDS